MFAKSLAIVAMALLLAGCTEDTPDRMVGTGAGYGQGGQGAVATSPLGEVSTSPLGSPAGGAPGEVGRRGTRYLAPGVEDRIFFDTAAATLSSQAQAVLGHQSGWLNQNPQVSVQIAGNCDERGTEEYNLALGERRANAARDYLVSQGISAQRIRTISYGKGQPTALGSTPEAWAQNRNAITSVLGGPPTS
jgi:peptidoglycan-associated lipoprotein